MTTISPELLDRITELDERETQIALGILEAKPDADIDTVIFEAKEQAKAKDRPKPERGPRGITQGYGIMANVSALNLGRLFASLVDPDRRMTDVDKHMAEVVMHEISGGARTSNRPKYQHKGEAKPGVKKSKEHSGNRWKDKRNEKKRSPFPKSLRPRN